MAQFHAAVRFSSKALKPFVLGISRLENEKPIAEIQSVGGEESSFAGRMFMRWGWDYLLGRLMA